MNKRFYIRLAALLMAFVYTVLFMSSSTLASGSYGTAKLVKSYNKDGKFSMVFNLTNQAFYTTTFDVFLTNEAGDVYARWNKITVLNNSITTQHTFSRSYAKTPEGKYKMNIAATTPSGTKTYSWVVNNKKVVSATFKDTYKVKNVDGTYSQKFRFSVLNGKGKMRHLEIYTEDGQLVTSFQKKGTLDNCIWSEIWNYYPKSGVKMESGTYILKYWVDGTNPKQQTVTITI